MGGIEIALGMRGTIKTGRMERSWQSGMKNEMHQNLMISGDLFCTTSFLLCFSVFTHLLKGDLSQNFSSQTS